MKKALFIALLLLTASSNAGYSKIVIAYSKGDVPVNSFIDLEADYVAIPVSIYSDAKNTINRLKSIHKLQSDIKAAADKNENFEFSQGVVSLSPKDKSTFSSIKSYGPRSSANFYLFGSLENGKDVYTITQEIYSFVLAIQKPKDTTINLGNTSLGISSPEEYRTKLLELLKTDIEEIKQTIGSDYAVSISGLDNPVLVRQKNDKEVTVFIDYRLVFNE